MEALRTTMSGVCYDITDDMEHGGHDVYGWPQESSSVDDMGYRCQQPRHCLLHDIRSGVSMRAGCRRYQPLRALTAMVMCFHLHHDQYLIGLQVVDVTWTL